MRYKAIIFDFDNTISQTDQGVAELLFWSLSQVLPGQTPNLNYEFVLKIVKQEVHFDLALKVLAELFVVDFDKVLQIYKANTRQVKYAPVSGFMDFWRFINEQYPALKKIIVTNRINLLEHRMQDCGLSMDDFDLVLQAKDLEQQKPSVYMFAKALDFCAEYGITASDILSIGDTVSDYQASCTCGVEFWMRKGGSSDFLDLSNLGLSDELAFSDFQQILLRLSK